MKQSKSSFHWMCNLSPQSHTSVRFSSGTVQDGQIKTEQNARHTAEVAVLTHAHTHTHTSTTLFCIMSFRHTLPPASRPWGLNAAYIYGGGDLFKHMLPLTKSSMSNHPQPQPFLLPPLGSDYNATFSLASITLEGRRGGWRENKDFCC